MTIVKTHPAKGYDLLLQSDEFTDEVKNGVLQHHERSYLASSRVLLSNGQKGEVVYQKYTENWLG
jgi:hypothetical protein